MEKVVYTFEGKNNTTCFVTIEGDFLFNSIVTTNTFGRSWSPLILEHTYIIRKY